MSDPKRLLDGAGDDFEVQLLTAGREERPLAQAVEKTLLAIGLGGTVATGTAAATAAGTAQAVTTGAAAAGGAKVATAGAAVAPVLAKASVPVLVTWAGVAAVGGLGTLSAIDHLSGPPVLAPATTEVAVVQAPVGAGTPRGRAGEEDVSAVGTEDHEASDLAADDDPRGHGPGADDRGEQTESVADRTADQAANVGGADAVRKRRLADEVAALDRARTAMAAGDPAGALAAIDHYETTFERKMLGPEARTLRIEALMQAGRRGEARAAAARFLAADPSSTHARRVRSLITNQASAGPARP